MAREGNQKLVLPYEHDPQDLTQIWMAVSAGEPSAAEWKAAYRDELAGVRVIWVKYAEVPQGNVWVRDRTGVRRYDRSAVL